MATAPKKSPAPRRVAFPAHGASDAEAMRFLVFEDNTGGYRWMIVGEAGGCLAQSETFASFDEADRAARIVRQGAGSAHFERVTPRDGPVDLIVRREAAARESQDADRWLDEGGSFSSAAVAQWPTL